MIDFRSVSDWFEERRREVLYAGGATVLAIAIALVGRWWFVIRWQPPPNIFDTPVEGVLGYLSMDDFSELPLEERVAFLMGFADRFRGMEQDESAAMAAFLAGLAGPAREQATQNARELAKDILVDGAASYVDLPQEDRAAYLDDWISRWMRMGEKATRGEERDLTDEERLADVRGDAERGMTRERSTDNIPELTSGSAVRFMDFWSREVETTASPREQGQIVVFMRDLRKHLSSP